MKEKVLKLLEKNARISLEDIASELSISIDEVCDIITSLQEQQVICGFATAINWDNTDLEVVTAMIEVTVKPEGGRGFDKIAEKIYKFEEVKSLFLMSGGNDFTIIIEASSLKQISRFVSEKLSVLSQVNSTNTKLILKKYKEHGIIFDNKDSDDERMIVTP